MTEKDAPDSTPSAPAASPKISPAWWAWLMAIACFAIALLSKISAPPNYFLPFAILGIGAGITVLQCSRVAKVPRKKRITFCGIVTAVAWIAFGLILSQLPPVAA